MTSVWFSLTAVIFSLVAMCLIYDAGRTSADGTMTSTHAGSGLAVAGLVLDIIALIIMGSI